MNNGITDSDIEEIRRCVICGSPNVQPDETCPDCLERLENEEWADYLGQFRKGIING